MHEITTATTAPVDSHHPLRYPWTLWFMHRAPGEKITDYESAIKKINTFSTIEEFWQIYSHLQRPNDLPNVSDYHLFKAGIRPIWEDDANKLGGKWMIRLKKGLASRFWEQLIIAIVSEQFNDDDDDDDEIGGGSDDDEICGAVLSMRHSEDILSVWNRTATGNVHDNLKIRETIGRVLGLEEGGDNVLEYKAHDDSIKDQSSYRNTNVYK